MPFDEHELVNSLLERDERAMAVFYRRYHASLLAAVHRIVHDRQDAEDVVQVGMVKVWRGIASFDPEKSRLSTWAAKICCNTAIDHVRTARYRLAGRTDGLENADTLALSTAGFWPENIGVADLLLVLRPEHRQVMDLLYLQGCTQLQAAECLNVPVGTVKTWVGRARQLLSRLPL